MRRLFPLLLAVSSGVWLYACSSSNDSPGNNNPDSDGGTDDSSTSTTDQDGSTDTDSGTNPDSSSPTGNPIEGIGAPTIALAVGAGTVLDGPTWQPVEGALYFTIPTGTGTLIRLSTDGGTQEVRVGEGADQGPQGSTYFGGAIVTAEGNKIERVAGDGGATTIATMADGGTFLCPNDAVAKADGTLYVTDPAYCGTMAGTANRIYKVTPGGVASIAQDFGVDIPRPNGIALSKDEHTLFVSFTDPPAGTPPYIGKYTIAVDGSLTAPAKFADVGANTAPDGLAIDDSGNVYCAIATGVEVFKPDGTAWGKIAIAGGLTSGVAFGGADRKTLYMTTDQGKIYQVKVNIAGLVQ